MKHYLFLGSAIALALCATGTEAKAQYNNYPSSYSKGDPDLMKDTRRMDPPAVQTMPGAVRTEDTQVYRTEYTPPPRKSPYDDFTGIYGGGDVGYSFTDDAEGENGSLFLGYGFEHKFRWLGAYAGLEVGHEWSGADGGTGVLSYEKDRAWFATLRPGVSVMGDGLGYGIIGYTNAKFESGGADENLDGLMLGLGAQLNTHTAFKPRLEYIHTNYEEGRLNGTSFAPTENAVKLGAVFQF